MKDKRLEERIQHSLNAELSGLRTTSYQRDQFFENATGGYKVKRKISTVAILVAALMLITVTALAATGAFQQLWEVWQSSFKKMNTTGAIEIVEEFDYEAFEEENGGANKELIISTVPGDEDMSLDAAITTARAAIIEKYGIDESVIDAMGIYPRYYETPYQKTNPEWHIYFTSLRDVDIDEDHQYPAPGEFRVYIESPSGNITYCYWYNDDFWSNGDAEKTWDSGKYEAVHEQALLNYHFYVLNSEQRQEWMRRFETKNLDISVFTTETHTLNRGLLSELMIGKADVSILETSDPLLDAALKEIEKRYGITKTMLSSSGYIAIYGPGDGTTRNIIITYNYEQRDRIIEREGMGTFESNVFCYAVRLGAYSILIDPETESVVSFIRMKSKPDTNSLLLGRNSWYGEDWTAFSQLLEDARKLDSENLSGAYNGNIATLYFDRLMRNFGADPSKYALPDPDEMLMPYEEAEDIAVQAVSAKMGCDESRVRELYPILSPWSFYYTYEDEAGNLKTAWSFNFTGNENQTSWYVTINLPEKDVSVSDNSDGNG